MKRILCLLLLFTSIAYSQKKEKILEEGIRLYQSEKASWHGTDIFLERYPEKRNLIRGYFSYSDDKQHHCVFYDKDENPNVLARISFEDNFDLAKAVVDTTSRKLTKKEYDYYDIRTKAMNMIQKDTLFKQYENTGINPIPIITKKEKKVYVLTGPKVSGVVIFGNDYLIEFDKKNNIKTKKKLHNNIIGINYNSEKEKAKSFHNHNENTGNLITPTDICTLLLYGKYANWDTHYVMSNKNVSIWNVEKEDLFVLTKEAWDKIQSD